MAPAFSNPFTMQKIEDLLKLTNAQQQEPQPQASGTEIVNREMERAMRPAPNPWENQIRQGVLGAKQAYNAALDAYNSPQSSAEQQAAAQQAMIDQNAFANRLRNAAQSAELNTSGYGEGVSLADTQSYLDSEKARDITEALKGSYSMTTDQFYERKYEEAIMRGLSPRRANRLAGSQAREYQANRVAYLDGLYNSWGHNEAGATNPIGMQVLGMIAQDNPMLANIYAQAYPNPRDAYNTENEMAKQILQNDQAVKLLGIEQDNALQRILAELEANTRYSTHEHGLREQGKDADVTRDIDRHAGKKAIDIREQIKLEEYKNRAALDKIQKDYGTYRQIAQSVLSPEELETWDKVYLGLVGKGGQANQATAKDSSDKFMTQYVNMIRVIDDRIKKEQSRLIEAKDANGEKHNAQIQTKIQELENQRQWLYDRFQDIAEGTRMVPDFTGNENVDVKVAEMIRDWALRNGHTDEQIRDVIFKQVKKATGNEKYAKQIAGIGMH